MKFVRTLLWVGLMLLVCFERTLAQSSEADPKLRYLENGQIKVGLKIDSGAGIAWISAGGQAPNLVNAFDRGRLIQQSYYGTPDVRFGINNLGAGIPVQGGDWRGASSQVLDLQIDQHTAYAKTLPKHWASGEDITSATMQQWIELSGPVAKIKYRFEQRNGADHPAHHQEYRPCSYRQVCVTWSSTMANSRSPVAS